MLRKLTGACLIGLLALIAYGALKRYTDSGTSGNLGRQPRATARPVNTQPSGQSPVVTLEHQLEKKINQEATTQLASYHPTNGPYSLSTACRPTTPDEEHWSCSTTISNSFGTACIIATTVYPSGGSLAWRTPNPFLSSTQACNSLFGNLGT